VCKALGGTGPSPGGGWRSTIGADRRLDVRPLAVPARARSHVMPDPQEHAGDDRRGAGEGYGDSVPPSMQPFVPDPTAALERFVRAAEEFCDKHVRHSWPPRDPLDRRARDAADGRRYAGRGGRDLSTRAPADQARVGRAARRFAGEPALGAASAGDDEHAGDAAGRVARRRVV